MKVGDLVYYWADDLDAEDTEVFLVANVSGQWVQLFEEGPDITYTRMGNLEVISEGR